MFDGGASHWTMLSFSEAVEINPPRPLPKSDDVPFLDMASLPLNGASIVVSERRPVSSGGARFRAGDTLFARITPCAENGKLGYVQGVVGGDVAQGSTEFVVMSAREGLTLPEYVSFIAGWGRVREQAIGLMEGTSGRQRVPSWAFDEIDLPVPPLNEQRLIVDVLRSVDLARTENERACVAANNVLQACLTQAFANAADEGSGRPLESLLKQIIDYRGVPPPKCKSGVPLLTAKNVRFGYLDPEPREFIAEQDYDSWMRRGIPSAGDILFTTEAPLGFVAEFPAYKAALGQRPSPSLQTPIKSNALT